MAKAESKVEQITITTKTVQLEMTPAEAETLAAVLTKVGGSPRNSPRRLVDGIRAALRAAGVREMARPKFATTYDMRTLGGFTGVVSTDGRHTAELLLDRADVVFREYPPSWTKAERGEDN